MTKLPKRGGGWITRSDLDAAINIQNQINSTHAEFQKKINSEVEKEIESLHYMIIELTNAVAEISPPEHTGGRKKTRKNKKSTKGKAKKTRRRR
jgi:hypothetical protein